MLSYPSAMTGSTRALTTVTDLLRRHRTQRATRWRKLTPGRQALLVVAYLRKGETYTDLAGGFGIGTSTVYRYLREAIGLLAATAPTLAQAIEVAARKAFVILDGTMLRIDRVGMGSGRDRPYYSGKHKPAFRCGRSCSSTGVDSCVSTGGVSSAPRRSAGDSADRVTG